MNTLIGAVQAPFTRGGAEALVDGLGRELTARGHRTDVLRIPLSMQPRAEIVKNCLLWRMLDVEVSYGERIDLMIPTKFPSYLVRHPRKVVWLFHQMREIYELHGTTLSGWDNSGEDRAVRDAIHRLDRIGLSEAVRIYTISHTVARRLKETTGLDAECLYHPPPLAGLARSADAEDFVLSVGRLDATKRVELLVESMAHVRSPIRAIIAGEGPEAERLKRRAEELGVADRVSFLGRTSLETLIDLYARALAVFFAPVDEDYGYVTLEAFLSRKPVLTADDSGGVLEFVEEGATGRVLEPDPERFAEAIEALHGSRARARALGDEGHARVAGIGWSHVLDALTSAGA